MSEHDHHFMQECTRLALAGANLPDHAGIGAIIVIDGVIVARGINEVHRNNDPTRHAEIVALSRACSARGEPNVDGATLYSSLQPCEMCMGALAFAGVRRVVFAAQKENVAAKYFMYPGLEIADFAKAASTNLSVEGGVMEDQVLHLYADGEE